MATVLPPPPPVLSGRYRLDRRVAQGGMAEVWLATDQLLSRQVAVKLLKPSLAADPVIAERFRREAIAVAQLTHPNVVAVYDTVDEGGRQAVVMQFVHGRSLREILDAERKLSPERTIQVGIAVAAALGAAHEAGLVHRDVKPGNIMLTDDHRVLLTDFGIAKASNGEGDLTSDNVMMGTAKYLSPEQVRGRRLDGRADLYSLGLVLYECLAGRVPFQADTDAATALARLQRDPTPLARLRPTLPSGLVEIIHRLLARNPDERPASSVAVQQTLERILTQPADVIPPTTAIARPADTTPPAPGSPATESGPAAGGGGRPSDRTDPSDVTPARRASIPGGPATPGAGPPPAPAARTTTVVGPAAPVTAPGRPGPTGQASDAGRADRRPGPTGGAAGPPPARPGSPSGAGGLGAVAAGGAAAGAKAADVVRPGAAPTGSTSGARGGVVGNRPASGGAVLPGQPPTGGGRDGGTGGGRASATTGDGARRQPPGVTGQTPVRPGPPRDRAPSGTGSQPVVRPGQARDTTPTSTTIHGRPARQFQQRWAPSMVLVGGLLVVALIIALILAAADGGENQSKAPATVPPPTGAVATVVTTVDDGVPAALDGGQAKVFDPSNDGENDTDLPNIFDGSESTVWNTACYQNEFMGAQGGIGVMVPLTKPGTGSLTVTFPAPGWQAAVYASNSLPTDLVGWGSPLDNAFSTEEVTHTFSLRAEPHSFVMVWLKQLPRDRSVCSSRNPYRGGIAEMTFTPGAG